MSNASAILARKLEGFEALADEDRALLSDTLGKVESAPAHTDLIKEGDRPSDVFLILEGFACRYKHTLEGERQIMAYLIPGDLCDLHVFVLKTMDHSIGTLSSCRFARIPRPQIVRLMESPRLARALMCATLVDSAVLREWLVNLGQRPAEERVAHLFCELLLRMEAVGLAKDGDSYSLPLTQSELADTMGMTDVHMNRVLQSLRGKRLVVVRAKSITIPSFESLKAFSGFNPNYLHLNGSRGQLMSRAR